MLIVKTVLMTLLTAAVMMATTPSQAHGQDMDAALQALDDALPGTLLHNPYDMEWDRRGNDLRTKVVDAEALSTGQAISARLKKKQAKAWDAVLTVQIPEAVAKGEEIQIFFYARTHEAAPGLDTGNVSLFVGRNEEPYDNIIAEPIFPANEWTLMNRTATAQEDYPAGTLKVEYQLGLAAQTVEFGPVYVSSLGQKATR